MKNKEIRKHELAIIVKHLTPSQRSAFVETMGGGYIPNVSEERLFDEIIQLDDDSVNWDWIISKYRKILESNSSQSEHEINCYEETHRRSGRTTRDVDWTIQNLFRLGKCVVSDHHKSEGADRYELNIIINRMRLEHPYNEFTVSTNDYGDYCITLNPVK